MARGQCRGCCSGRRRVSRDLSNCGSISKYFGAQQFECSEPTKTAEQSQLYFEGEAPWHSNTGSRPFSHWNPLCSFDNGLRIAPMAGASTKGIPPVIHDHYGHLREWESINPCLYKYKQLYCDTSNVLLNQLSFMLRYMGDYQSRDIYG